MMAPSNDATIIMARLGGLARVRLLQHAVLADETGQRAIEQGEHEVATKWFQRAAEYRALAADM